MQNYIFASGAVALMIVVAYSLGYPNTRVCSAMLSFCVVCWFTLLDSMTGRGLSWFSPLGNLTYSSYLIHFPVQLCMLLGIRELGLDKGFLLSPWCLGLYLTTTFGMAWMVYQYFEIPMQDAIRSSLLRRITHIPQSNNPSPTRRPRCAESRTDS